MQTSKKLKDKITEKIGNLERVDSYPYLGLRLATDKITKWHIEASPRSRVSIGIPI